MRTLAYLITALIVIAAATVGGLVIAKRMRTGIWTPPTKQDFVEAKQSVERKILPAPGPPRVIYLHREKITLRGGSNAAHDNMSRIVGDSPDATATLPGFSGSKKGWKSIVSCVKKSFAPFDVEITETRPSTPGYVMVVVGGKPADLGNPGAGHHAAVGGLAPYSPGEVVHDAVVFAFARALRNRSRTVCETIAMEVAHAYGLDHAYYCKDLMTYRQGCRRSFVDKAVRCGESKPRDCGDGKPTQNSYRYLLNLLGSREKPNP